MAVYQVDPCRFDPPRRSIIPRRSWRRQMVRVWRLAAGLTQHATSILHFYTFFFRWAQKSTVPTGVATEERRMIGRWEWFRDGQRSGWHSVKRRRQYECACPTALHLSGARSTCDISNLPLEYSHSSHYHSHKLLFTRLHHTHTFTIQTDWRV